MLRRYRIILPYSLILLGSVCLFFWIRSLGSSLAPAHGAATTQPAKSGFSETPSILVHVLLSVIVTILAARALGMLFRKLSQPPVIGELIAGILLGPSFFGLLAPAAVERLLPGMVAPYLAIISEVGVILYMFLVGVDLDTGLLRQRTHAPVVISHASMIVPFLLGATLALWLFPHFAPRDASFTAFALLIAIAMSVTAFPVLARILTDCKMHKSPLGVLALSCASVDDVTAWCLLALLMGVVRAQPGSILLFVVLTAGFILFVFGVVKRGAIWLVSKRAAEGKTTREMFAIVCVALLLGALATERIGIHALFGAFLIGTVIPHDSALARDLREKCEDVVLVLLLPVFFVLTGMRTQIGLLQGRREWLFCLLIIGVACLGKFGGCYLASRWTGSNWREATSVGVLLNTRGLMELIVLNIGLDLGLLSPALFTMFVLMAVVTTVATTPVLQALTRFQAAQPSSASEPDALTPTTLTILHGKPH
jgi:Kef-type K+ transport system membrane component KefB